MTDLHIGTCSWKYPSWEGLVYSSKEPQNYLLEYAQVYDSVEIDQWFWSLGKHSYGLPSLDTVTEYDDSTPPSFKFTIKCPNAITKPTAYQNGEERNPWFLDPNVFMEFLSSIDPLIPKVGLFMFQFEYLNQQKMESQSQLLEKLSDFFEKLPSNLPYAIELRNPRWLDGRWIEFLRGWDVAPVLLQGYWMEDIARFISEHINRFPKTICIRLHGDDRNGIEEMTGSNWDKVVTPRTAELKKLAPLVKELLESGRQLFINVNNHYEGSSPLTIDTLKTLLEEEGLEHSYLHRKV